MKSSTDDACKMSGGNKIPFSDKLRQEAVLVMCVVGLKLPYAKSCALVLFCCQNVMFKVRVPVLCAGLYVLV